MATQHWISEFLTQKHVAYRPLHILLDAVSGMHPRKMVMSVLGLLITIILTTWQLPVCSLIGYRWQRCSTTIVGCVAVFSRRALPLAAWTNGLEIAAVKADVARSSLILETGVTQRWRYGGWRTNQDAIDEAENWEDCKQAVKGIHFLAVQPDPDSEELSGLWLLQDRPPPQI
ncbi:uncharacterized protein HaLaN_29964 [Haematococcus lacustris]|uniref:RNA-binding protein Tab2/Atab2 C-terminal domain-containing protein n=1 Tax=Haematococcus lacustris TaxID=44745 RepID=A0A6A0AGM3_HAELA|nr:uncharacterized protein HaLaN_29964 [Haematococcus lacustris]